MRSSPNALKVLLDTSFILPTLGFDVGGEVEAGLRRLDEVGAELYYSRFSILEALWVAAKLVKDQAFNMERFSQGLRSIIEGGRYIEVEEGPQAFKEALRLYMLGHRDLIDNILYASSANLSLQLLTLDAELREFIQGKGLKDVLMSPDELP